MDNLQKLKEMIHHLYDEQSGCGWIKSKDIQQISYYSLEEVYELIDAIEKQDGQAICSELSDLLYHLLLYAEMGAQSGEFTWDDVVNKAIEKQERRRYPDQTGFSAQEIHAHWNEQKRAEREAQKPGEGLLDDIPNNMPALIRSKKIQDKTEQVGFDWKNVSQILDKLKEEVAEFEVEVEKNDQAAMRDELGDILFTVVNIARHVDINPERALREANDKFVGRFQAVEQIVKSQNQAISDLSFDELLEIWERAKKGL